MEQQNRIIGALFLSAFPLYGIGINILENSNNSSSKNNPLIGLVLLLANSLVVLIIGRLLQVIAVRHDKVAANVYFIARFSEALLLAIYGFLIYKEQSMDLETGASVTAVANYKFFYNYAMISLGIGSLPILNTFKNAELIPSWLALFGFVGYSFLTSGIVFNGLGIVKDSEDVMKLMMPGALFEITFALWLIMFGFPLNNYTML